VEPTEEKTVECKVAAIMTAPRHEITWCRNVIERSLREIGLPLVVSGGVFYGQCMQIMLEDLIALGNVQYAVTIDYDSVFNANDIRRLIRWMLERPDINAITGVQVRRGKPTILGTFPDGVPVNETEKEIVWEGHPLRATTAHFGLTVIDLKKLESVPKPWFLSTPNAQGCWTGDKIDDDVHFWLRWKDAGNTVYIDPGVRLGHLEEVITMFDENMQQVHMYPKDWEAKYGRGTA